MKKARTIKRLEALLVDLLISLIIAGLVSLPTIFAMINCLQEGAETQEVWALLVSATTGGAFLLLVLILYFSVVPVYFDGQTFGKRIAKIKLVDIETGKKPETRMILMRETVRVFLVFITFGVALIISFFSKLLTKESLSFYDAISRTIVVEVEPDPNYNLNEETPDKIELNNEQEVKKIDEKDINSEGGTN